MNQLHKKLIFFSLLCCLFNLLYAQTGVYDPAFGTGGKVFQAFSDFDVVPQAVILQADGKIIAGGSGGDFSAGVIKIVRYHSDGSIDAGFGTAGISSFDMPSQSDILQSLALQPNGNIICGGITDTYDIGTQQTHQDFSIFRLKTNGTPDSTFGTNGFVVTDLNAQSNDVLHKVIVKPDGKILAGGYFMDLNNGDNYYGLVQYNADGTIDSSFGTNGKSILLLPQQEDGKGSLALLPNGKILAATTVVNATSGFYEYGLLRFNADGSPDTNFGNAGILHLNLTYFHSVLHEMAIQSDGKIVLTGETDFNNTAVVAVVRVDSEGAYDMGFGVDGVVRTHISAGQFTPDAGVGLTIQPDKKIIVGCTLDNAINSTDANFAVIRYLANGAVDSTFGRQGIIITDFNDNGDFARACLQQPDGKLVLVGSAESQAVGTGIGLVRYLSDARFYYNTLKGSVFYDDNGNGVQDAGEDFFGSAQVAAEKQGIDTINITASSGRFSVDVDTGNYIIHPIQPSAQVPYFVTVPVIRTTSHSNYFNTDSVWFAMRPIPGKRDIFVYVIPLSPARPGFTTDYMIVYGNKGTDTVLAGTVKFVPGNLVNVTSTSPSPSFVNVDTLAWNYVNLYPRDTSFIIVHATIQAPPIVNIGDTLHSFASIAPTGLDLEPKDNIFALNEDVVGSLDPNDKSESHAGQLTSQQVAAGEYLQYMIRFQNTGTDTAFNIYVRDTLQNTLDWNSMEMVASSHAYRLVRENGICVWTFSNIGLPAVSQNEPASHGFVVFRIKPRTTLGIGDIITNTASIYFDYNLPVGTNTETTSIVTTTLPVKLLSFSAKKAGKTNLLVWSTANEVNTDRFEIERSASGIDFEKIGSVQSKPGSAGIKNYGYTNASPLAGFNYYRLKTVDNDGKFEYSPVRILKNTVGDYFAVYPNPVNDILRVNIEAEGNCIYGAQLVARDGRTLFSAIWNINNGSTVKTINIMSLPSGSYFLKLIPLSGVSLNKSKESLVLKLEKL